MKKFLYNMLFVVIAVLFFYSLIGAITLTKRASNENILSNAILLGVIAVIIVIRTVYYKRKNNKDELLNNLLLILSYIFFFCAGNVILNYETTIYNNKKVNLSSLNSLGLSYSGCSLLTCAVFLLLWTVLTYKIKMYADKNNAVKSPKQLFTGSFAAGILLTVISLTKINGGFPAGLLLIGVIGEAIFYRYLKFTTSQNCEEYEKSEK